MNYTWQIYLTCPLALPSWLLTCVLEPFLPFEHAWYGCFFSLPEWYLGRTEFTCDFDVVMWFTALCGFFVFFQ